MRLLIVIMFGLFSVFAFWATDRDAARAAVSEPVAGVAEKKQDAFKHSDPSHKKLECASCHKAPTANWQKARAYPDVSDYPGHAACFSCHQKDIFSGNQPKFCGVCHTNPGPSGVARLEFPDRRGASEFKTIFPHDIHQDVIASHPRPAGTRDTLFVRASFRADDPPTFNNCAICHQSPSALPTYGPRALLRKIDPLVDAVKEDFVPKAAFFKDNPTSHASCFQCHYQNAKPVRSNCAGCHEMTSSFKETPVTSRYSLKFDHSYKDHVNKDCTTCHVRITQTSSLRNLKDADVPVLTCSTSSCHQKQMVDEIGKRDASIAAKAAAFQCNYCHSPEIGRYPTPSSHKAK